MTAFYDIPFFLRSLFALWAFLLCVAGIAGIILSLILKRHRYMALSLAAFAPSYFLWQVIFNLYRFGKTELTAGVSIALGGIPWFFWLLMFIPITFAAVLPVFFDIRYSRTYITPLAIKRCADRMNCGICYWLDSGRVIFSNICMNRLCAELTGEQLLNGKSFHDAVSDSIRKSGNEVWRFASRDLEFGGRRLHEMVASDITEIHTKTEMLRRDNVELSRMNDELRAYSMKIDDTVRRQEILQAKVCIHDEMNRLMLATAAADSGDPETLDRIFTQWNRNALLLCMEAEGKTDRNAAEQFNQLAELLKLQLVWHSEPPGSLTEGQKALFFTAAKEAAVNAVKHAGSCTLEISFEETETEIRCCFENDGNIPPGDVCFSGGLANLSILAEEQDATVSAETGDTFRLFLIFAKKA